MSARANLSPFHLLLQAWQTLKRRPWLAMGMRIAYAMFTGGGGRGYSQSDRALSSEDPIKLGMVILGLFVLVLVVTTLSGMLFVRCA